MKLIVAKIGKTVGLRGELKLHLDTDFPQQFKKRVVYKTDQGDLKIESYNPQKNLIKFENYNSKEDASRLTNLLLFSDEEQTKKDIELKEGEYFWFDIIGCAVYEEELLIGEVDSIERYLEIDYLKIVLEEKLSKEKKQKRVLVPYNDSYVLSVDVDGKKIAGKNITVLLDA